MILKPFQMKLGPLLGSMPRLVISKTVGEGMATLAVHVHEEIRLPSNLVERVQDKNLLDHKWLRVFEESRVDGVLQFVRSPSKGIAAPDQIEVQVNRWRSKLP